MVCAKSKNPAVSKNGKIRAKLVSQEGLDGGASKTLNTKLFPSITLNS